MKRLTIVTVLMLFISSYAWAGVQGAEVAYQAGDVTLKGYLVYDQKIEAKRPGILVVHEWWGHNEYARKRARMLAELGYTALAVDMYGDGKRADHPDDAGKFSGELLKNLSLAKARFLAALELLTRHPSVDTEKVAAIGYCFGGGMVLEMARVGLNLRGVVSFHGSLGTSAPARPDTVKARVLVLNGADDPFVSAEQVDHFKQEMETAGADYRFVDYPGAKHSFTNPEADAFGEKFNLPLAYDADADAKSWQAMRDFFDLIFQ